jgi:[ribosomal protein S5]-alanine N-acetyltransferase
MFQTKPLVAGHAAPIGMYGLIRREGLGDVDLGYAREAAAAWLARGLYGFGLKRVVANTKPDNALSQRVLQSIGMRFERRVRLAQATDNGLLYAVERISPAA